jgi:hypothetical protein
MNNYATHLPILKVILNTCNISNIFEYGMGSFSTPLFVEKCKNIIAIEMQEQSWFDKMVTELKLLEKDNYSLICLLGPTLAIDYFNSMKNVTSFDLVFVDGDGGTRPEAINEAIEANIPYIVTHDTEWSGYGWERIKLKNDYIRYDIKKYTPWTTVFTKDTNLIETLKSSF